MAADYVVLGIVQGAVEWLPVSSEAVVSLVAVYMTGLGPEAALRTSVYLHLGTTAAAALYLRSEVVETARTVPELARAWMPGERGASGFWSSRHWSLGWLGVVSTPWDLMPCLRHRDS